MSLETFLLLWVKLFFIIFWSISLLGLNVQAQEERPERQEKQDRVAMLIGNSEYMRYEDALLNPCRDVERLAEVLESEPLNFKVFKSCNVTRSEFNKQLNHFTAQISEESVVFFYYSGHAVELEGQNYLLPVDYHQRLNEDFGWMGFSLNRVVEFIEKESSHVNLILLDACRDNPLPKSKRMKSLSAAKGLALMQSQSRTLIGFATGPGKKAWDGDDYSPYLKALVKYLPRQDLTTSQMMNHVAHETSVITNGEQVPWTNSSILPIGWCLAGCKNIGNTAQRSPVSPLQIPMAKFIKVVGGQYNIGCSVKDKECESYESPRLAVSIDDFYLAETEVTFEQYDFYCERTSDCQLPDDEGWGRAQRPVINVSWEQAQMYIQWLNQQAIAENGSFRLPTESEWEYAARAGEKHRYAWGHQFLGEPQWRFKKSSLVKSQPANPWGLYDMMGSVWEWCEDRWYDSHLGRPEDGSAWHKRGLKAWLSGGNGERVIRGGSWYSQRSNLRFSFRNSSLPTQRHNNVGFRLVRDIAYSD